MKSLSIIATTLLLTAGTLDAQQQQLPADSMQLARKYSQWLYAGMADSLFAHTDSASRSNMSPDNYSRITLQIATRAGNEVSVIEEKFVTRNGQRQYWRTANMDVLPEPLLVRFVMTPKGEIAGIGLGPASQAPPIDP